MSTTRAGTRDRRLRRRVPAIVAALIGAFLAVLVVAPSADAHAVLVRSSPLDGSRVAASPAEVTLTFDETVELVPGAAKVLSGSGGRVDDGTAHVTSAGDEIVVPLHPNLPRGSYLVTWRVVSADSHIVTGSITFGVRQAAAASGASATPPTTSLGVAADAAVGAGYLGIVLALGVPGVGLSLWPSSLRSRRTRRLAVAGVAVLVAGALFELVSAGPRAAGTGWSGLLRLDELGQTLSTAHGLALLVRVILGAGLGVLFAAGRRTAGLGPRTWSSRWGAGLAVLGVATLVTVAFVGHASVGPHVALAMLAAVVHLAAMATWLGGLTLLLAVVLPRLARAPRVSTRALGQWSAVAFGAVAALVVTGEYQGWRQVQPLPALWTTAYGITLLIKVALVCVALAGAYVAQRVIVRRDGASVGSGRARLAVVRRSVRFEACAVALVLVATTVLVSQPPAAASYGPPVTITTQLGGEDDVRITVDTTRRGPETFTVTVVGPDGKPVAAQQIAGTLSSTDNGVAGIDVHFVRGPGRSWHSVDATVPLAGTWTITLDVSVDEATGYATQADFQVW